jgi:hypothetical protein
MLKDKLMKKLGQKGAKDLEPHEQAAKMGVVKELGRQASSLMSDKIHPMKKVTVASDSKEGLKAGLDKASGLVDRVPEMEHDPEKLVEGAEEELGSDLDHDGEAGESDEHLGKILDHMTHNEPEAGSMEQGSHEEMHPDEIDAKIAHLQSLKAKKLGRKA